MPTVKTFDRVSIIVCSSYQASLQYHDHTIIRVITLSQIALSRWSELDLIHYSGKTFCSLRWAMAQLEALALAGPTQFGRGVRGRCVYWIVMACPTPKMLAQKPNSRPPKGLSLLGVANEFEAFGHLTTKATPIPTPINNYPPKMPQTYKKPLL